MMITYEDLERLREHLPRLPFHAGQEAISTEDGWHIGSPEHGDFYRALAIDQGILDLAWVLLHPTEDLLLIRQLAGTHGFESVFAGKAPTEDLEVPKGLVEAWLAYRAARLRIEKYLIEV